MLHSFFSVPQIIMAIWQKGKLCLAYICRACIDAYDYAIKCSPKVERLWPRGNTVASHCDNLPSDDTILSEIQAPATKSFLSTILIQYHSNDHRAAEFTGGQGDTHATKVNIRLYVLFHFYFFSVVIGWNCYRCISCPSRPVRDPKHGNAWRQRLAATPDVQISKHLVNISANNG